MLWLVLLRMGKCLHLLGWITCYDYHDTPRTKWSGLCPCTSKVPLLLHPSQHVYVGVGKKAILPSGQGMLRFVHVELKVQSTLCAQTAQGRAQDNAQGAQVQISWLGRSAFTRSGTDCVADASPFTRSGADFVAGAALLRRCKWVQQKYMWLKYALTRISPGKLSQAGKLV